MGMETTVVYCLSKEDNQQWASGHLRKCHELEFEKRKLCIFRKQHVNKSDIWPKLGNLGCTGSVEDYSLSGNIKVNFRPNGDL